MKKYLRITIFFLLFGLSSWAHASEIFFSPASMHVAKGDLVKINVYLKTEGEDINAAQGHLVFPNDLLSVSSITFGNSILNFWPEQPHVLSTGIISFSGVTPGGYNSTKQGLLFSVIFKASNTGTAPLSITDGLALLDDGQGTPSKLSVQTGSITIVPQTNTPSPSSVALSQELDTTKDTDAPETFIPMIGRSTDLFDNKFFIVFSAIDKQSGIDHYDIQESHSNLINDKKWIHAESPYMLSDQSLHSFIFVKAFDRAGNGRIEIVSPLYPQKFYQSILFWVIIIVVIALIVFSYTYFKKNKKKLPIAQ